MEGTTYINLGENYHHLGEFETAIEFHQQGLSIIKDIGNKAVEGRAYALLGMAYQSLGNFKAAIEFHQQALTFAKDGAMKSLEGRAYDNLGMAYQSLGDSKTSIDFHQKALLIAKDIGDKALEGVAYNGIGTAYRSLGDVCKAEEFYKSSVLLYDDLRDLLQSNDEWKISLRNRYKEVYNDLWIVQLEQDKTVEALFTAERGRAQALKDLLKLQYGITPALKGSDEQMNTISAISTYISSPTVFLAVARKSINFWVLKKGQECQFVKKEISDSLQNLIDQAYKEIGVFKSVKSEDRSLYGSADDESEKLPDRSPDEEGLTSSDGKSDALKALSDVVISPISHLIEGEEVLIVPDGPLLLVPHVALMDQHSKYISEKLRIRLLSSLTSLKLMAECPEGYHRTTGALLVGDPWVESVRIKRKRVKQLPGARKEVEMIGAILEVNPVIGKDATKAEVLSRLNSVALVHIAAHGCPETGEIVLSPNSTSSRRPKEEDFLLTMADVLNAKLQARLVVLSCCHSGRGKIKAEGVVGIARAFLGAGARSVLASLWAINDEATLEFMRKFYKHLMEGQSVSTSLNQAMKGMRESDNPDFSDVKNWAPFVLIGDDVRLKFDQTK